MLFMVIAKPAKNLSGSCSHVFVTLTRPGHDVNVNLRYRSLILTL